MRFSLSPRVDRRLSSAVRAVTPPTAVATRRAAPLALVAAASLLASPLAAEDTVPLTLAFAGEFGGQPFDCGARFENVGSSEASVAVADYRLYVSRVRLLGADGSETPLALDEDGRWQGDGVALLDFEDATGSCANGTPPVNSTLSGRAPAGDYTGVAFDIGVPFESNHGDPTLAGSPLNLTALFWNWRGGYRFMRVDLTGIEGDDSMAPADGMKHGRHGRRRLDGGGRDETRRQSRRLGAARRLDRLHGTDPDHGAGRVRGSQPHRGRADRLRRDDGHRRHRPGARPGRGGRHEQHPRHRAGLHVLAR